MGLLRGHEGSVSMNRLRLLPWEGGDWRGSGILIKRWVHPDFSVCHVLTLFMLPCGTSPSPKDSVMVLVAEPPEL